MRKSLKISAVTISLVVAFAAGAVYGPRIASGIVPSAEAQSSAQSRAFEIYPLPGSKRPALGYCVRGIEYIAFPEGGVTPRIDEKTDRPARCNF